MDSHLSPLCGAPSSLILSRPPSGRVEGHTLFVPAMICGGEGAARGAYKASISVTPMPAIAAAPIGSSL